MNMYIHYAHIRNTIPYHSDSPARLPTLTLHVFPARREPRCCRPVVCPTLREGKYKQLRLEKQNIWSVVSTNGKLKLTVKQYFQIPNAFLGGGGALANTSSWVVGQVKGMDSCLPLFVMFVHCDGTFVKRKWIKSTSLVESSGDNTKKSNTSFLNLDEFVSSPISSRGRSSFTGFGKNCGDGRRKSPNGGTFMNLRQTY